MPAAAEARRIRISKVSVESLPFFGPAELEPRTFKVVFRAGTAAAETCAKQLGRDNVIQWTEPLAFWVRDAEETLVATIESKASPTTRWSVLPGCRFEDFPIKSCPSIWRPHPHETPGCGRPMFRAQLETFTDEGYRVQGANAPPPEFVAGTHEGVNCCPVGEIEADADIPPTLSTVIPASKPDARSNLTPNAPLIVRHRETFKAHVDDQLAAGTGGTVEGPESLLSLSNTSPSFRTQGRGSFITSPLPTRGHLSVREPPFLLKSGLGASAERHGGSFPVVPLDRASSWSIGPSTPSPLSLTRLGDIKYADKPRTRTSRGLDVIDARLVSIPTPGLSPWSPHDLTEAQAIHSPGTPCIRMAESNRALSENGRASSVSLRPLAQKAVAMLRSMRWWGRHTSFENAPAGCSRTSITADKMEFLLDLLDHVVREEPDALGIWSVVSLPNAPTAPPPIPTHEEFMNLHRAAEQSRLAEGPLLAEGGSALNSPAPCPISPLSFAAADAGLRAASCRARISQTSPSSSGPDVSSEFRRCQSERAISKMRYQFLYCDGKEAPMSRFEDGDDSRVQMRRADLWASYAASVPRRPSRATVSPHVEARVDQPLGGHESLDEAVDALSFGCFAHRCVSGGVVIQLRISTSSRRIQLDEALEAASRERVISTKEPGELLVERGSSMTVELDLPDEQFKILEPDALGSGKAIVHHTPSTRTFTWNGIGHNEVFQVVCQPGAPAAAVRCGMRITQGDSSSVTRLSFNIDVVADAGKAEGCGNTPPAVEEPLNVTLEEVNAKVAAIDPVDVRISAEDRTRGGAEAWRPAPFLLASHVDPGPSVHESEEHGFRLTVRDGSLDSSIGPISIQQIAQVVQCEDDGQHYLVKTMVDCRPSGAEFSGRPLLMDFRVQDISYTKISKTCQVLVRKGRAGRWRGVKSEVRVDWRGAYVRAAVDDFCWFTCGTVINRNDPVRLERCRDKHSIEVTNATAVEIYLVLVPVAFDSDKTSHVTYTGSMSFCVPGGTIEAGGGSDHEHTVKRHLLPAGFTPDEISVLPGGTFSFTPPPGARQAKLLVATITEEVHAEVSVRVVVLHNKFNTREGKRREILPACLQTKSKTSARLGRDDIPVNMVMIMAGLGSDVTSATAESTPDNTLRIAGAAPVGAAASLSTGVALATEPPPATQGRGGTNKNCRVS